MLYFCVQKLENESLIFVRDLEKESLLREKEKKNGGANCGMFG